MSFYQSEREKEEAILQTKTAVSAFLDELGNYRPMHGEFREDVQRLTLLFIRLQDAQTKSIRVHLEEVQRALAEARKQYGGSLGAPVGYVMLTNEQYNKDQAEIAELRMKLGFIRSPGGQWIHPTTPKPKPPPRRRKKVTP